MIFIMYNIVKPILYVLIMLIISPSYWLYMYIMGFFSAQDYNYFIVGILIFYWLEIFILAKLSMCIVSENGSFNW